MKGELPGRRRAPRKICANFSLLRTLVRAIFAMSNSAATPTPLSYKDAGVDIDAGDALVERIKPLAKKTMREGVLAGIGGCTGWGSTGVLNADPDPVRPALTDKYALGVYRDAQKCDPWPGGEYPGWWWDGGHYSGSTVEAAVQVLTERGWCDGAEWATDLEAFVVGVATRGPALMGTVWMDGMSQADSEGVVHATGKNAGGHCYYITQTVVTNAAASPIQGKALIVNSWGTGWADNGTAWISFADLDQLFKAGGQVTIRQLEQERRGPLQVPAQG